MIAETPDDRQERVGSAVRTTPRRLLLVLPGWVGDLVLATPAIEAVRNRFPDAQLIGLLKPNLREVLAGSPWLDEVVCWREPKGRPGAKAGLVSLARRLRREPIDLAITFANSFRSALLCWLAGARCRAGYAREGRSLLLTARLQPEREGRDFKIVPVLDYYNRLVEFVGAAPPGTLPMLFTTSQEDQCVDVFLDRAGVDRSKPFVVINPGGQYGAAKCWLPERYARVSDALHDRLGAEVFINVGPHEAAIAGEILRYMSAPAHNLAAARLGLGGLKALVKRSALMITNDTGPRHFAVAFGVPVVTIFGPTHPGWTQTCYTKERIVSVPVDCGPCQKRVCPLDLRCMTGITEEMVLRAAMELGRERIAERVSS